MSMLRMRSSRSLARRSCRRWGFCCEERRSEGAGVGMGGAKEEEEEEAEVSLFMSRWSHGSDIWGGHSCNGAGRSRRSDGYRVLCGWAEPGRSFYCSMDGDPVGVLAH